MNRGTKRFPKYFCDKCGVEIIRYTPHTYYKYNSKKCAAIKDFDLCTTCNEKLINWLKEKKITTTEEMINRFPIWKGVGGEDE